MVFESESNTILIDRDIILEGSYFVTGNRFSVKDTNK